MFDFVETLVEGELGVVEFHPDRFLGDDRTVIDPLVDLATEERAGVADER
jgi:hypothetical protein